MHRHLTPDSEQDVEMYTKEHEIWSECALKKLELQRVTQKGGEYWVGPYLLFLFLGGVWQVAHNEHCKHSRGLIMVVGSLTFTGG